MRLTATILCRHIILSLLFIVVLLSPVLLPAGVTLTGSNRAEFIYLSAPDSLATYFHNRTDLVFNYRRTEFGISFRADLPRYSHLSSVKDLSPDMINYLWDNYYLTTRLDNLTVTVGSFQEFFGKGIILRSFKDEVLEWDTTLNGLLTHFHRNDLYIKGLYAALPNDNDPDYYDTVSGLDIQSGHLGNLNLGISLLSMQELNLGQYRSRLIRGSRLEYFSDLFDISAEYSDLKLYRNIAGTIRGDATYAYANTYIKDFTLSTGYKKYNRFNSRLSDLPNLNSTDYPLSGREPGSDEEGFFGQIMYLPDYSTIITLAYSEAWNSSSDIKQSDLYFEGGKDYDNLSLGIEFGHFETLDEPLDEWRQEITAVLKADYPVRGIKSAVKLQYQIESETKRGTERESHYPLMQYELFFNKYTFSLFTEARLRKDESKMPFWTGLQLFTTISDHSEIKLFAGKERGGKTCRNGQCFTALPFQGLKLEVTTRF